MATAVNLWDGGGFLKTVAVNLCNRGGFLMAVAVNLWDSGGVLSYKLTIAVHVRGILYIP